MCLAVIPYYSIDSELVTVVSLAHTWPADIWSAYLSILRNSTYGETHISRTYQPPGCPWKIFHSVFSSGFVRKCRQSYYYRFY